jgi:oxygen-independent coproporphyrinogen III oxidase
VNILSNTIERLGEAGYIFIGMDHFARPDDELAIAQKEGKLHRNFQGYSTQAQCDLLAFGISSIGKVDDCYSQNVRTLDEYYAAIDEGHLPTLRGLQLNTDDLLRRDLIGELMCQFSLDTKVFAALHKIDFESYFHSELEELKELEEAGLLEWHGANLVVPIKGRLLARRVAMSFDRHLRESKAKGTYSKVL